MHWITIALCSYFLYAMVNIAEKYIIDKHIQNPLVYLVWANIIGIISLGALVFFPVVLPNSAVYWIFAIGAGVLYFAGSLAYLRLLRTEEITRISIWLNMIPLATFALSFLFINETLTALQLIAFCLLVIGGVLASLKREVGLIKVSSGILFAVLASVLFGGYFVLIRAASAAVSTGGLFLITSVVVLGLSLFFFTTQKFRRSFVIETMRSPKKFLFITTLAVIIEGFASLFLIWALASGPASLISAMGGLQSMIVLAVVAFLSWQLPGIIREKFDLFSVSVKIAALLIMVGGVALLYLGG